MRGFTIVELVTVMTIIPIIVGTLIFFFVYAYRDSYIENEESRLAAASYNAFMYIEQSVRTSDEFLVKVDTPYVDPYGPHNIGTAGSEAWSYKGVSRDADVLILDQYATSANGLNAQRLPVYRSDGTFNCTTQKQYQPKLKYIQVIFVRDRSLYRRTLTNTSAPLCSGDAQSQKQSCPPELSGSWNAVCRVRDEVLASEITTFRVDYYQDNRPSSLIDAYNSSDPLVLEPSDYIIVTLTFKARGDTITNTMKLRMVRMNA